MWKSCEFMNLGFSGGSYSEYSESYFNPHLVIANWSAGFTPPLGIGLGVRIWAGELYYDWPWWGPFPTIALRASYSPFMNWQEKKGELLRYARTDIYLETGSDWKGSAFLRSGITASVAPSQSLFPWSVELGIRKPLGYGASIKPYAILSSTFLSMEKTFKPQTLTVNHFVKSGKTLNTWLGFEFANISGWIPYISKDPHWFDAEITFAKFGLGFAPPIGAGIWMRLWTRAYTGNGLGTSLRATYTPLIIWDEWRGLRYRAARFDLFAEAGKDSLPGLQWRTGLSGSFSLVPFLLPLGVEVGRAGHSDSSWFYLSFSSSLAGGEVPILSLKPRQKPPVNYDTFSKPKVWGAYKFLEVGLGGCRSKWSYGSLIDPKLEITFAQIGIGLEPPAGIGIWGRGWMEVDPYSERNVGFSFRNTYCILMTNFQGQVIKMRNTRIDIFAEPGLSIWADVQFHFRAGISTDNMPVRFGPSISAELGWEYQKKPNYWTPSYADIGKGLYFLVKLPAFSGVLSQSNNSISSQINKEDSLNGHPTSVKPPPPIRGDSLRKKVDFTNLWCGFNLVGAGLSTNVGLWHLRFASLSAGIIKPLDLGCELKFWRGTSLGNTFSLRASYSFFSSWAQKEWGLRRKVRFSVFVEPMFDSNDLYLNAGISSLYCPFDFFVPITLEAGCLNDFYNSPSLYLMASTSITGGEYLLNKDTLHKITTRIKE